MNINYIFFRKFLINSKIPLLSMHGFVLGINITPVNPPLIAALQPVKIVSFCSYPGSQKFT